MRITDKYVLFWGSFLSNFEPCVIQTSFGVFTSAEQMFMHIKAITFGDEETAELILKAETPKEAKKLGRSVKGFREDIWETMRVSAMRNAVLFKFSQNEELKRKLLSPEFDNKIFVEANPFDTVWAIGMREEDPRATDPSQWQGQNLLGQVINEIRETLLDE